MKTNRRILTGILFAAVSIFLRPLQAQVTNSGIITAVSAPRQVVNVGQNITLSVTAPTATSFQWKRNGLPIGGATAATYTITGATTWRDNGWYQAVALNATTSTSSAAIFVLVKNPAVAFAWGGDTYGESQVPSVTGELVGIAAGGAFNFLTRADGTLLGFGNGMYNQTSPPEGLSSVVAVALGQGEWLGHALALKADGTISGWGYPYEGLLRFPTTSTGVVALAAGSTHSLALKSDGTVLGWGVNPDGRISIPSGLDNVVAIAAGLGHTLVLRADGTVSGLGSNDDGQLSVPRDLSGVKSIAAGGLFSLALSSDGTVVGWGNNSNGQTTIPAGLTNVVAIAAGTAHCLARQIQESIRRTA
jgi:hypothetical protein